MTTIYLCKRKRRSTLGESLAMLKIHFASLWGWHAMSHVVCTLSSLAFLAECHFVRHVHFVTSSHGFSLPSLCHVKVKSTSLSILWWMTIWAKCIWACLGSTARTVFVLRVYQSGFSRGREPVQCIYRKRDLSGWLPWYNLGDLTTDADVLEDSLQGHCSSVHVCLKSLASDVSRAMQQQRQQQWWQQQDWWTQDS